jgi:hypothetical protein
LTGNDPIKLEPRKSKVEAEREACLKIAMDVWDQADLYGKKAAELIASAIRARS